MSYLENSKSPKEYDILVDSEIVFSSTFIAPITCSVGGNLDIKVKININFVGRDFEIKVEVNVDFVVFKNMSKVTVKFISVVPIV